MASCSDVHDWIENGDFDSKQQALQYIHKDYPTYDSNPNLYDCVDSYDFEFEFVIYKHLFPRRKNGTRKAGSYYQLHKIRKADKHFVALGIDSSARASIIEHLRGTT